MKSILCLLAFVAVAAAELKTVGVQEITYETGNIFIHHDPKNGYATLRDKKSMIGLDLNSRSMYPLSISGPMTVDTGASVEAVREIEKACKAISGVINDQLLRGKLDEFKKTVRTYPNYVHYEQYFPGVEILVATNGLAYLKSESGVVVQVTPNSLKVKELNGEIKDVSVADPTVKMMISSISSALAEEAKDWIASGDH